MSQNDSYCYNMYSRMAKASKETLARLPSAVTSSDFRQQYCTLVQ
jgi:hypothetical protein